MGKTSASGRPVPPEVAERAATKYVANAQHCWITSYAIQPTGYAYIAWQGPDGKIVSVPVHRAAYQHHHGSPPRAGGQVDHTCHDPDVCKLGGKCPHRGCVNPAHLADGTARDNVLRSDSGAARNVKKDRCPNCGSEYVTEGRGRRCVPCRNRAAMVRYHRNADTERAEQRERYARNREARRAALRERYWADPEAARAAKRKAYRRAK